MKPFDVSVASDSLQEVIANEIERKFGSQILDPEIDIESIERVGIPRFGEVTATFKNGQRLVVRIFKLQPDQHLP